MGCSCCHDSRGAELLLEAEPVGANSLAGNKRTSFAQDVAIKNDNEEDEAEPHNWAQRKDHKCVTKTQAELDKIQAQQNRNKRQGISAEVVTAAQITDFVKPVYPKTAAELEAIKGIIKANEKVQVLLGSLNDAALQDVINAFFKKEVKKGESVITQGDEGDCLYICEVGELDIFVARPDEQGKLRPGDRGVKVLTVGAGALFGELALMYTAPRAATVVVASETAKLWALERQAFKILLVQTGEQQFQKYEGWLSEVDILKSLNHHELSSIASIMDSALYDDAEEIIKQGDPGDCFYIVEDGTCAAYISGPDGEKEVKTYTVGDYFGEIALLTDEPRKATVRATGDGCSCIFISKEDFTNILGPVSDILRANIDKYPKYASILANS